MPLYGLVNAVEGVNSFRKYLDGTLLYDEKVHVHDAAVMSTHYIHVYPL